MKGGSKFQAPLAAVTACRPAQGPLGGYVNCLRRKGIELFSQPPFGRYSQVDTCVARARPGFKQPWVYDLNPVPQRLQLPHQLNQRGNHTVDLWLPRVSN